MSAFYQSSHLSDVGMRINLATFAYLCTIADIGESTYIYAFSHLSLWRYESQRIDAGLLGFMDCTSAGV